MRRQSDKGRKNAAEWSKRKREHLRLNPACVFPALYPDADGECWGPLDANHIQPRSAGGTRFDNSPLVTVCRKHHQYLEMNRAWARSVGLLMRRAVGSEDDVV